MSTAKKRNGQTVNEPEILFTLADNVAMTEAGLVKRCAHCGVLMPLRYFPEDKNKVFKRKDYCIFCDPVYSSVEL